MAERWRFGERRRRYREAEPYLETARKIGTAAAELAVNDTSSPENLEHSLAGVIARLTAEQRQNFILNTYDELPPQQRLRLLQSVFGDSSSVRVALEARRLEAGRNTIAQLAELAVETDGIDLELLPMHSVLGVTLVDKSTYDGMEDLDDLEYATAQRRLRLGHLGHARFHLIEDVQLTRVAEGEETFSFGPEIDDQQVLEIGSLLNEGVPDANLVHTLYLGGSLGSTLNAGTKFEIQYPGDDYELLVIGHVDINDMHILGKNLDTDIMSP